jgi:two-component system chemotaxis sensor kinase CheA
VDIRPLAGAVLSAEAIAVLEEQLRVAAQEAPEGFPGRVGSAGQVAAHVLRRAGLETAARTIVEATRRSQHDGDPAAFADAIRSVLGGPIASASAPTANGFVDTAPRAALRALRVDVERIDALVNLAGELTVAKNAIGHTTRRALDGADRDTLARALKDQYAVLDRQVGALQRSVLALRVLPMSHVFQRFPRLAREIAGDLGKSVRLLTEGETTEADKAIVEALFEPLLHVLRNAVDHGVEPEAERRAAGKPPTATIRLRAGRDGEHVIVEVADDGRGIDIANLREIAARRDIVAAGELAAMTDEAVLDLIFAPGFSTAETVTALSGRGVGMDAVRSAVARMGGQVAVKSQPGAGTSVVFTLPFTLMMLRVMTVEASGQVFGIPLSAVIETTSLPRERISRIGAGWAFVLRDHAVPVLRLSEALDLPDRSGAGTGEARVVLITVDGQTSALEVDAFGEWMDVMLKPMEGLLAGVNGLAGTTLLGDGRVLIVLDPRELPR